MELSVLDDSVVIISSKSGYITAFWIKNYYKYLTIYNGIIRININLLVIYL